MIVRPVAVFIAFFFSGLIYGQEWKRTMNWYFGNNAGISFATNPPNVLTDGIITATEGCASISDTSGNLLFYTNGVTVWNKNHQVMDNGTGLNGHISSTQSSLIVPAPGNDSLFYIFTTDAVGQPKGLQYSVANMNENGGLGKIVTKNIQLHGPVCEKLTATHHQNGRDIWVVTHAWGDNSFCAFLITPRAVDVCPVISRTGSNFSGNLVNAQGALKVSADGALIASTVFDPFQSKIELFSFNTATGRLTPKSAITGMVAPYSVEFSKSNRFLYASLNKNTLVQYDLLAPDISASKYEYLNTGSTSWTVTSLQMGPDGRIYITYPDSSFIGSIDSPDLKADSADFVFNTISVSPAIGTYGLPNFISSYFDSPALSFKYATDCSSDSFVFVGMSSGSLVSPQWTIYKNTALIHAINGNTMSFNFPDSGKYLVRFIASSDTVSKEIVIDPLLELGKDTLLCNVAKYTLDLPKNLRCIEWQDNADTFQYPVIANGTYYVSAHDSKGCVVSDTVRVRFGSIHTAIIKRSGDSLSTDSGAYTYRWFRSGSDLQINAHAIRVVQTGAYEVEITDSNGCSSLSQDFNVTILSDKELLGAIAIIYPNPSQTGRAVHIESTQPIVSITVRDLLGRQVFQQDNINQYNYELNGLRRGVFIVTLNGTSNYKIMIEHTP